MKKSKNGKRLVMKKWLRITLCLILFLSLLTSGVIIYNGLFPKDNSEKYYEYKVTRDADYKVYLKDNEFYEDKYLEKDKDYPANLIDFIDINLSYLFDGNFTTNMNYGYSVSADIIGEYTKSDSNKTKLWTKKYPILQPQNKQLYDTKSFDINQNIKLDYEEYNKIVSDFSKKLNLPIDAYLKVTVDIDYNGIVQKDKQKIKGEDMIELDIPLTNETMKITPKYTPTSNEIVKPSLNKNMKKVYLGIILLLGTILIFVLLHNQLFINKKNYYSKVSKRIFKKYKNILVETKEQININDYKVIDITNFIDLVDVEREFKSPILFFETIENKECEFIVIKDEYAYRYILNNSKYN